MKDLHPHSQTLRYIFNIQPSQLNSCTNFETRIFLRIQQRDNLTFHVQRYRRIAQRSQCLGLDRSSTSSLWPLVHRFASPAGSHPCTPFKTCLFPVFQSIASHRGTVDKLPTTTPFTSTPAPVAHLEWAGRTRGTCYNTTPAFL